MTEFVVSNPFQLITGFGLSVLIPNFTDSFCLIDSDDVMLKDCLKDAYHFHEKNPESKFYHNYYTVVNDKGIEVYPIDFPAEGDAIKTILSGNFLSCIGVFIHREIYQNLYFNEDRNLTASEDREYWMRVLMRHKLGVIDKINCYKIR